MLPEYAQARKAIWDAVNPHSGKLRIDEAFPPELRKATNKQEMKIELKCGSIWQVVGSDNFNSLLGSPPVGIVFSEWSLANPMAYAFLSPILAENGGWAVFIYTARGYNHGYSTYQGAQAEPQAFAELLTVEDTQAIPAEALAKQLRDYKDIFGDEDGEGYYRQEFYNDWSVANPGAILGRYMERAEREGRINDAVEYDNRFEVVVSSDIGRRDASAWWFWQARPDGYAVIDYEWGSGLDAEQWIARIAEKPYKYERIWLPHDAAAKTFATKLSAQEQFEAYFGRAKIALVPRETIANRINAARVVAGRCYFAKGACKAGLEGLRSWTYKWDDQRKVFSQEPEHDWASHPGDGFSYGAQIMKDYVAPQPKPTVEEALKKAQRALTFNDILRADDLKHQKRARI